MSLTIGKSLIQSMELISSLDPSHGQKLLEVLNLTKRHNCSLIKRVRKRVRFKGLSMKWRNKEMNSLLRWTQMMLRPFTQ